MAYLGNNNLPFDPTRTAAEPRDADRFSGNGSLTSFTLSRFTHKAVDLDVFVENVRQEPIVAYDVNGTTITFTEAIPSGTNNVYVVYRKFDTGAQIYVPDGSISYNKIANNLRLFTTDNLTPNGNNSVFTMSEQPADANTVMVTVDGIVQRAPVHYQTSGSTITFTSPPPAGSNVHVRHLGFRTTTTLTAIAANTFIPQPTISGGNITANTTVSSANFSGNIYGQPNILTDSSVNSGFVVTQVNASNTASSNVATFGFDNSAGKASLFVSGTGSRLRFGVQAVECAYISPEGYFTKSFQPSFIAAGAPGGTVTTSYSKVVFTGLNNYNDYISSPGNTSAPTYYSDANDRFTAPIGGTYLFGARTNILSYSSFYSLTFYKNGSLYLGNVEINATNFNRRDFTLVTPIKLAAGDYVEVYHRVDSGTVTADNSGHFWGYLLG